MAISPLAGKPAPKEMLVDLARLEREYFERRPDLATPTSWSASAPADIAARRCDGTFTEAHILAITQAICDYRRGQGTDGPLYMGKDTHALSGPAQRTALEVLAANGVETIIQRDDGVTPTPVISRAILVYNRGRKEHLADGIVITPSHNPPEDGGFKYNPTNGGPADTDVTRWIQDRANELLRGGNAGVKRVPFAAAIKAATTHQEDFVLPYVNDLRNVIDMDAIRAAGLKLGVDPLGGAAVHYWEPINDDLRPGHRRRQPGGRSDLLVHDGRSRRQDPHGLLQPLCDGPAGRAQGPVPRRLRQRSRLGPARHRHAVGRADEPQSLPGRGHPLPAHAPARTGRRTPRSARRWSAAA